MREVPVWPQAISTRAIARFVMGANRHRCDVRVEAEGRKADGKSILQLSLILVGRVRRLQIQCSGPDARVCMQELEGVAADGFGRVEDLEA